MDAVQFLNTKIHCDTCHYEFEGTPPEWAGEPCPKCGAPDIITKQDLLIWNRLRATAKFVNELVGDIPEDLETVSINIKVDTKR